MANAFIKAERIVRTALGLLEREIVLPRLVWRDAGGDFRGTKNDTISIRLPAYTSSRKRVLRGGTPITMDELTETKIDVTLDEDIYKAVPISDEELTLDIESFGDQVLSPSVRAVARGIEDKLAALMTGATYLTTLEVDNTDPYNTLIDARKALNDANVPLGGRALVVGSSVEARILKSDHLARFDASGSDSALREAMIGRIAGFDAVISNAIAPTAGFAFHRTAYTLATRAPMIPEGATFGASESFAGLSMRILRDYDFVNVRDRLLADAFAGANIVRDGGYLNANGQFRPAEGALGASVTLALSAALDDIIDTTTAHGYVAGDRVVFTALTGGAGLSINRDYYVIAANLGAQTFQVSATPGGAAVDFTSDITAGSVQKNGVSLFVRAVKLTDLV